MTARRFFGNLIIGLGALNILNFWAPRPIPTVGPSAFILGILLMGAGAILKAERDETGKIQWARLFALLRSSSKNPKNESLKNKDGVRIRDPLLAVKVLRLAEENGGKLSVSQAAMNLNVPIAEAEAALDECASRGTASIEVNPETGIPSYRFPEFEQDR
ncbi:hypothetical protein MASR2M78_26250 [Treponema sp.]